MSKNDNKTTPAAKPTFRQVVGSVLAAMFGVQKRSNLERDNNQSNAAPYIIVALILAVIFVLALVFVANLASR
ncbi:MAG: DUF2970 domain-containing protein [Pseudomonadota bacterium]|jgi:uncharacterized membrane protein YidH (DUF202 family)